MSSALERRVKKLEGLVNQVAAPEVFHEVVLMAAPAPDAPEAVVNRFTSERRAALDRGASVIVMRPLKPEPATLHR